MSIAASTCEAYFNILQEELIPAFGCTEPIAIAYCAAKARDVLGKMPSEIKVEVSGNILKNVKSVIVPNTGGLKGIEAAAAAGVIAGRAEQQLQAIAAVSDAQKQEIRAFLTHAQPAVSAMDTDEKLEIRITVRAGEECAMVHIARHHLNIIEIQKNGAPLPCGCDTAQKKAPATSRGLLGVEAIVHFAQEADAARLDAVLARQIACNMAIAEEGMQGEWGAEIGKTILEGGSDVKTRAKAYAAAGSDARMSGCELPVIINSGSGNQGITVCVPVIVYARELGVSREVLLRALAVSNLIAVHIKTGIGALSAYCGAVSAGCAAACGIAWLYGGRYDEIAHTLVNSIAVTSGIICDGAKPSCAAKIASAVDAGILGFEMNRHNRQFLSGDGIVKKGVENTLQSVSRLGSQGMSETDREIIRIMLD